MAEERLLCDKMSLQVVRASVRGVLEAAEDVRAYLARSKDTGLSWTPWI